MPVAAAIGAFLLAGSASAHALIRLNQVGYSSAAPKRALVMSQTPLHRTRFTVVSPAGAVVFRGRLGARRSAWSRRYRFVYVLDFSRLQAAGRYRIRVAGSLSPSFAVGSAASLYDGLVANAVGFFGEQRDGADLVPGPLPRAPSHLLDAAASVYRTPRYRGTRLVGPLRPNGRKLDVSGGWFDAGDYLKLVETASFNDVMLLFALREYSGPSAPGLLAEARFGTDWLLKMWDPQSGVLYDQVGIGDGNGGHILGDHDIWRLPQRDDSLGSRPGSAAYYVSHRPVFAANAPGKPISPNLAGRTAAAFALCAQVFASTDVSYAERCLLAGQQLYARAARRWRGDLVSSTPRAYYSEPEWRDDMELAATELYLGTDAVATPSFPHYDPYDYMEPAASWANAYMSSPNDGQDSLNLYDVSAIAHFDLYRLMVRTHNTRNLETNASDLLGDLRDQLRLATRLASRDPFRLADPATNVDTVPHALGYAIEARLYDSLVGRPAYERLARDELDWVLGRNAWGSTFVVGAGDTFPRCLAHQVANLEGTRNAQLPVLLGATVDGPTDPASVSGIGAPDGFRRCPAGRDPYPRFDRGDLRYLDDVRSAATSEPTDDYTALGLVAFAQAAR